MGTTIANGKYLEQEHTFVPILSQMTFFLYPLETCTPHYKSYEGLYASLFSFVFPVLLQRLMYGIFIRLAAKII